WLLSWDKKKKAQPQATPPLYRNGRRNGRLGDIVVVALRRGLLFGLGSREPVILAEPAAQVNEPAAGAAKGELRPFGLLFPLHYPVAYRATYLYHRPITSWTSHFSLKPWHFSPERRQSLWSNHPWRCRRCRSCRFFRPPAWHSLVPPWPPACKIRCGSWSGEIPNP